MTLVVVVELYLITKLQNLKAIHNGWSSPCWIMLVVSNYKITKSESYSQLPWCWWVRGWCCI